MACLLSFAEQASWEELVRQGGLSNQKIKKGTFIRDEKVSFWQSPVKIRDIAGTARLMMLEKMAIMCKYFLPIYGNEYSK